VIVRQVLLSALAAIVAGVSAGGCNKDSASGQMQMPPPLVTITPAIAQDVPVYLDEIGKVSAFEAVIIKPQVAGLITKRLFQDGADIKKDQLLFTIDDRPFKAALDSAKAQLAQAKAQVSMSNITLQMYTAVTDPRAISKNDFDAKRNAVDVAQAQVEAAQAAVETAQVNLDYCQIRSPIDGRAGQRLVDAGNVVEANSTALLSIQAVNEVYADFTITERDLAEVQKQMKAGVLKTEVRLPSDAATEQRDGELKFLDNQVQDGTGTVKLRAEIANADHHYWPGQFVNIRLILTILKKAVLVPSQAIQTSQQGPFVYVVKTGNIAVIRPVTLGQRQGEMIVVIKGVGPGENVVNTVHPLIQPDKPVRIDSPTPGAAAPPGDASAQADGQPAAGETKPAEGGKQ
jgi:multidrug efflux system membrane fusion protein